MGNTVPAAAEYDRSREQLLGSFDANVPVALGQVLANVVVEPRDDAHQVELYGYGDPTMLGKLHFDADHLVTYISGELPSVGGSVKIGKSGGSVIAAGERSVASGVSISEINLGGNSPAINGIPYEEYLKAENGESDRYIKPSDHLLDLARKIYLRLVVPKDAKKIRIVKSYGEVAVIADMNGELRVNAECGFVTATAKTVGSLWLLLEGKSATAHVGSVTGKQRIIVGDGATATVDGVTYTGD